MTALRSERVLVDGTLVSADVAHVDGRITEVAPIGSIPWARDLRSAVLAPGLVDVQVNGSFGRDFTSDPESIWDVASNLVRHGVTAFCPTIITAEEGTIGRAQDVLARRPDGFVGAEPLGLHLEGPMISPRRRGAHPEEAIRSVPVDGWRPPEVRLVTLAPEVVGPGVIEQLVAEGVVVALGHTDADHDTAAAAFDAGARHATHLFNGMALLHHREPGVVGAALADPRITVSMIADGVHVHPTVLRLVLGLVGVDRFVATTDAAAPAGVGPGSFSLGTGTVVGTGDDVRLADGTLAGSVLTMDASVARLADLDDVGLATSLAVHSTTPARLLGEHDRGVIEVGARADLVAIDDVGVVLTVVGGTTAFTR